MTKRLLLLGSASLVLISGCTNRLEAVGPGVTPKTRTYSTHVQPVTANPKCAECHQKEAPGRGTSLGTYAYDKGQRLKIETMVQDPQYGGAFLSPQEIQDVLDWIKARTPDDSTPF